MARFFDAQAALSRIQGDPIHPIHPIHTIPEADPGKNCTNSTNCMPPDAENFEERAAIAEFDGDMSRAEAEDFAAQSQGYDNVIAFKAALQSQGGAS